MIANMSQTDPKLLRHLHEGCQHFVSTLSQFKEETLQMDALMGRDGCFNRFHCIFFKSKPDHCTHTHTRTIKVTTHTLLFTYASINHFKCVNLRCLSKPLLKFPTLHYMHLDYNINSDKNFF